MLCALCSFHATVQPRYSESFNSLWIQASIFFATFEPSVEHVTFVTIQHSDSTHRRVFSSRHHWCLNTSNSEIGSPIVATHNLHSIATFDKFSSCCAESEITVTRNRRSVRDTLRPCRLSCTCITPILIHSDPRIVSETLDVHQH